MPNNTFKGNAGTEVVSDILILQKRDRIVDIEPDWVQLGTDENGILMNRYFVEHPEMILGEMKMVSGRFGPEATCAPYEGADLAEQLGEAVSNIHGELTAYEVEDELAEEDNSIPQIPPFATSPIRCWTIKSTSEKTAVWLRWRYRLPQRTA